MRGSTPIPQAATRRPAEAVSADASSADHLDSSAPQDLIFKLKAFGGPTLVVFEQSGAFGAGSGNALAMSGLEVNAGIEYGSWNFGAQLQNYSLDFGTNTADVSQSTSKSFQSFAVRGGYGAFFAGVQARAIPTFVATGTNTLSWSTLTTIAPMAGLHFEKEYVGPSHRKFAVLTEISASKPVAGSGEAGGIQASGLSGFGANARIGAKKAVLDSDACKIRLGLEFTADYLHVSYAGISGSAQGAVTQNVQEYSTKLGVEFEF